ncbi:hypothetical protein FHX48_002572 [Microbacterium halimionae]|uniref:Signal transduction histidine kinase n=1 Tax=Microbacterium halimionae TaxID=1526413 RepID=A0A7W3PMZ2_9MICO|nr:hypothetical protein [Microbacterium halimionae]MBA8817467.1 hypothetical protein [Microbacterium halimionae]NII95090.1 hypothetical protein [Microbacterium halimionae]
MGEFPIADVHRTRSAVPTAFGIGRQVALTPALAVRTALTSRKFYTGWSALVSFIFASTVFGAYLGTTTLNDYARGFVVSALTWAILATFVLPFALLQRRLASARLRVTVTIVTLVAISLVRAQLNDALSMWITPDVPEAGHWILRAAVNLIIWTIVLTMVAVATTSYDVSTAMARRLASGLSAMRAADREVDQFATEAADATDTARRELHAAIDALSDPQHGEVDFERIKSLSEEIRVQSHLLDALASRRLRSPRELVSAARSYRVPRRAILARFSPPPTMLVGGTYALSTAAYTIYFLGREPGLGILALVVVGSFLVDILSRVRQHSVSPRRRGAVVVASWISFGAVIAAATTAVPSAPLVAPLIPLLGVPVVAAITALCTDAFEQMRIQENLLTQSLSEYRGSAGARTSEIRGALHRVSEGLHGRAQGRCVMFAAALDERPALPSELAEFQSEAHAAVETSFGESPHPCHGDRLEDLISTWSHVLTIDSAIALEADLAMRDPAVSQNVVEIVTEAFVNAIKHSDARAARVAVTLVNESPPTLQLHVSTPGVIRLRGSHGRGLANIRVPTRLFERDGWVVLEAQVPCPQTALGG